MEPKKRVMIVSVVLTLIIVILATTFAILTWSSSTNTAVEFTLGGEKDLGAYINYSKGTDVLTGTLNTGTDYTSGISTEIELWKSPDAASKNIYGTIYLDITDIGPNLSEEDALKWTIVSNGEVLNEGNFVGYLDGSSIELKYDIPLQTTKQTFGIYIWLDETMEINKSIVGETLSTIVRAEANDIPALSTLTVGRFRELGVTINSGVPAFDSVADTDEGIYTAEDDLGTSYYFRGASENNYVYFAGFYWRIVRINGDGTIRLIYDGTRKHRNGEVSLDRHIGKSIYNSCNTDNACVGYMFGTPNSTTYEATHENTNSSIIKGVLDTWYIDNMDETEFEQYVVDAIYCNDRKVGSEGDGIGKNSTYYAPYDRYQSLPTLKCGQSNDRFTQYADLGNGALEFPIALITMDEIIFAGFKVRNGLNLSNKSFYLYTGHGYWTMSPSTKSSIMAFCNDLYSDDVYNAEDYIKPVISLKADTKFKGLGTYDSPFYLEDYPIKSNTNLDQKFSFGDGSIPSYTVEVNGEKYVMPDVAETSDTIGEVDGIYYPIVEMVMSDGTDAHAQKATWYAYYPVFNGAITIVDTDPTTGKKVVYNSSTQTIPSGLTVVDGLQTAFNYGTEDTVPTDPVVHTDNILYYSSPLISTAKDEYTTVVKYKYVDSAGDTYYYYIGYHANAQTISCFTTGTLITLSDGTQKPIEDVTFNDKILAYDFFTGKYVEKNISILINHGDDLYKIANMEFSDGTVLRIIGNHGVFDYDLNKYIYITPENVHEYVGHRFVQYNDNGEYNIVTLDEGYMTEEYTGSYSLSSSGTSNAFASNMLTVGPPDDFYNWIEMSDKLRYDVDKFNQDVEQYGLYTYDDFDEYLTYDQYMAFNGAYLKIPVEKGLITFDYIIDLIDAYVEYMPKEMETFETGKYLDRYNYTFNEIK